MKKQTYIVFVKGFNNEDITFERFTCKRVETVKRNMFILLDNSLYAKCIGPWKQCLIFATPDGVHYSPETLAGVIE